MPDGRPVFVNTLFGCLAAVSDGHRLPALVEAALHLAARGPRPLPPERHGDGGGRPLYATAVSRSDVADGWRDRRADGGVLIEVESGEIVVQGLSMPHSPRLHGGRLWLLDSGSGKFGFVDAEARRFEPVAFCPGYARGLAFAGGHAIVGLSLARSNGPLPARARRGLAARDAEQRCASR